jgi:hypothetical protein
MQAYATEYTSMDLTLMHYIPPVRMIKIRGHILYKPTRYPTYMRGMYKGKRGYTKESLGEQK